MPAYVLDTSAIMCVLFGEDGADRVVEILDAAKDETPGDITHIYVPFLALMELEYWLLRRLSPREMEDTLILVESWPMRVVESTPEWRHAAAHVKATASLSVADAWIASLAILHQGELVHKDPEFDQLLGLRMRRLPYRSTS